MKRLLTLIIFIHLVFKVTGRIFLNHDVFMLAYSSDPDEIPHLVAFHQGLHCQPVNLLTSIQTEKG